MPYWLRRLPFVICCERFVIKLYTGIIKTSTQNDQQVSNISLKRLNDCPLEENANFHIPESFFYLFRHEIHKYNRTARLTAIEDCKTSKHSVKQGRYAVHSTVRSWYYSALHIYYITPPRRRVAT